MHQQQPIPRECQQSVYIVPFQSFHLSPFPKCSFTPNCNDQPQNSQSSISIHTLITHSLTYTHLFSHSVTRSFNSLNSLTQLTHSLTPSLVHSLSLFQTILPFLIRRFSRVVFNHLICLLFCYRCPKPNIIWYCTTDYQFNQPHRHLYTHFQHQPVDFISIPLSFFNFS